ncbi:MAG TPA: PocR ligand-binding domain-containing protein, partial [Bacillota bacterium]|nr:PocR ligand-binding domain-containing protein [Bacillota bacterium]
MTNGTYMSLTKEEIKHLADDIGIVARKDCFLINAETSELSYSINAAGFCKNCHYGKCSCVNTHLYGFRESLRWNGKYIYYCPLGLVFIASPVSNSDGLVAGPFVMGDVSDTLSSLPEKGHEKEIESVHIVTTQHINALSNIIAHCTKALGNVENNSFFDQSELLNS